MLHKFQISEVLEPKIHKAEELFPLITSFIKEFENTSSETDIETQLVLLESRLSEVTGKDITRHNYNLREYWEADGLEREAFKIALPDPPKNMVLTKGEVTEIVKRIKTLRLPDELMTDFVKENKFEWEIIAYYHEMLRLNCNGYDETFFDREQSSDGSYIELSVTEIAHKIWKNTMNTMNNHINYIELYAPDLEVVKKFYSTVFGWTFTDYGPTYTAFSDSGVEGGFEKTDKPVVNGALVVLHHDDLESVIPKIEAAGGKIVVDIFSFPGGRRFQFQDPSGNELAVWCES